jgi:hypothetical protein
MVSMVLFREKVLHVALGAALSMAVVGACGSDSPGSKFDTPADGGATSGGFASSGASSGSSGGLVNLGGDASAPASLYFAPATATIVLDGTGSQTSRFALIAVDAIGRATDVTAESVQFDRPDLATVTVAEPVVATAPSQTAPYGGSGTIHAVYHGKEAVAKLTVQVHVTDYGTGITSAGAAVAALGATIFANDPAGALLYPYDGTVWPLGLTSPLLMWNAPQAGDVYHLRYEEKNYTFDGYYPLRSLPGQLRLDQGAWDRITASNDARNGADPLKFSVHRWDSVTGLVYATASQTWTVAPESLQGAIYYWTASSNAGTRLGHITRFYPGAGATPQQLNNGACMGCHAVNAQGTVLVADVDDQAENTDGGVHTVPSVAPYDNWSGTRPWAAFDITQASAPLTYQSTEFGADLALTPDGKYLVFGGPATPAGSRYISLGEVATGNVVATSGLDAVTGFSASETSLQMPAFSPDGKMLAVVESNNPGDRDNVLPGTPETIAFLTFHQSGAAGPTFDPMLNPVVDGTSSAFATTGGARGYPSVTPDSSAIAFHAGHTSTGCSGACDDSVADDGDLFIATVGGGSPIRLAAADDPPDTSDANASVEPTFNPVQRGGYSWAVFTSMRAWGNKPWPSGVPATGHVNAKRRLWVTAVDPTIGTTDPSHPAIYLEGQDDTPNMRGFWTLAACVATPAPGAAPDAGACTNGFSCCSGFCSNGVCVDLNKIACAGVTGPCASAADCCNSTAVTCTAGKCTPLVQ